MYYPSVEVQTANRPVMAHAKTVVHTARYRRARTVSLSAAVLRWRWRFKPRPRATAEGGRSAHAAMKTAVAEAVGVGWGWQRRRRKRRQWPEQRGQQGARARALCLLRSVPTTGWTGTCHRTSTNALPARVLSDAPSAHSGAHARVPRPRVGLLRARAASELSPALHGLGASGRRSGDWVVDHVLL
jgi:hypothetical protein